MRKTLGCHRMKTRMTRLGLMSGGIMAGGVKLNPNILKHLMKAILEKPHLYVNVLQNNKDLHLQLAQVQLQCMWVLRPKGLWELRLMVHLLVLMRHAPLTELSMADSFVLGVLRGFRLLQASGLSHEDKRDIISSTRGSLDFDVICRALQTMWDEQLLGTRHGHGSFSNHYVQHEAQYVGDQWDDSGWWDYDAMYEYGWDDWEDGSWHDDFYQHGDHHEQAEPSAPEPSSTSDAMAAASQETQNESFAMDGQRTWSEAQRATAALRRDRGFGQVKGSGKSFPGRGCFICGGNHSYRDCPDQGHPGSHFGKSKGKSSFGNYFTEYDMHDNYFVGKGKGKHKGNRGRQLSWMEAQAIMKGKKGKSKGFSSRPPVNAYVQDMFVGGMEAFSQDQPRNSSTKSGSSMKPGHGLLDCGATASAGPEDSVNNLITAVLSVDKGASIRVAKYMRPYFRFGNGRWGQALHRVSITSKVSGKPRTLQIYSLPNPSEDKDSYGVKNVNLVPVLLGMDHLSGKDQHESSLAIDFTTGLALDPLQEHPVVFQLPSNHKGHYIRDLVEYLTLGFSDLTGTPSIHVVEQGEGTEELQVLEFHPVEYYDISNDTFTFTSDVEKIEQSRQALMLLHSSRRACMSATLEAINSSMLANPVTGNPNSISLTSGDHGLSSQQSFSESGSCGVGQHQSCNPQEESGSRLRLLSHHAGRPKRSTELEDSVAMLRGSCAPEAKGQSSWTVDSLCNLRVPHGVHTSSGVPKQLHQDREPSICDQDVGGVGTSHAGTPAQRGCVPCDAQQDLCGGATSPGHQEGDCEYGDQDVWVCQGQESLSCQQPRSVLGNALTIGSQKFLITIDFIDSARNINFDLKIDISRSKSRNLNFCDIGANIEISILKYRNLNFEISESQYWVLRENIEISILKLKIQFFLGFRNRAAVHILYVFPRIFLWA